jgi:hypothetical protein
MMIYLCFIYLIGKLPIEIDENKDLVTAVIAQNSPMEETPPPIPPRS